VMLVRKRDRGTRISGCLNMYGNVRSVTDEKRSAVTKRAASVESHENDVVASRWTEN